MIYRLQGIEKQDAWLTLVDTFGRDIGPIHYYSWPQMFSTTLGPFTSEGRIAGQAFTEFQMEAWTDGMHTLVFCMGREVDIIKHEEQPFSVEWYTNRRSK